jgi:hypothetical protein
VNEVPSDERVAEIARQYFGRLVNSRPAPPHLAEHVIAGALAPRRVLVPNAGSLRPPLLLSSVVAVAAAVIIAVPVGLGLILRSGGNPAPPASTAGVRGGSVAPNGTLTLSGAITATVTARAQHTGSGCRVISSTPLPPATTPVDTSLTGDVDFAYGSAVVVLTFSGAATTLNFPLPGNLKVQGPPGTVGISVNGTDWSAGQSSPTSSGTLTLSLGTGGRIFGAVDASLAPLRGSLTPLHVAGSWSC